MAGLDLHRSVRKATGGGVNPLSPRLSSDTEYFSFDLEIFTPVDYGEECLILTTSGLPSVIIRVITNVATMKGKFFSTQITLNSDETAEEGDRISDVCCTRYGCLLTA